MATAERARPAHTKQAASSKSVPVEPRPQEIQLARNCYRNVSMILSDFTSSLVKAMDNRTATAPDMALLTPLHNRLLQCLTFVYGRLLADAKTRDEARKKGEEVPAYIKAHAKEDNHLAYALLTQLNSISVIQALHLQVLRHRETLLPASALRSNEQTVTLMRNTLHIVDSYIQNVVVRTENTAHFVPPKDKLAVPANMLLSTEELQNVDIPPEEANFFTGGNRALLLRLLELQRKRMQRIKTADDGSEGAHSGPKQVKRIVADLKALGPAGVLNPSKPTVLTARMTPSTSAPASAASPTSVTSPDSTASVASPATTDSASPATSAPKQRTDGDALFDLLAAQSGRIDDQRVELKPRKTASAGAADAASSSHAGDKTLVRADSADTRLINMLSKESTRRIDDQRFELSAKKERDFELNSVMHAVDRLGHGRLEDQRSESTRQLKALSLNEIVTAYDRVASQMDDQRFVVSPKKAAQMELGELIRDVETAEQARMEDQDADGPEVLRDQRLEIISDIVERMNNQSLDSQRFVKNMARELNMTEEQFRMSASSLPSYSSNP